MKITTTDVFAKSWKTWIHERRGSHVAVLLRSHTLDFNEKTWQQKFLTELRLYCQVDHVQWQGNRNIAEELWGMTQKEYLLVFGNFRMLQEICRRRNEGVSDTGQSVKRPFILFFSTEILWEKMVNREFLWIRDRDGVTLYLGKTGWEDEDLVVLPSVHGTMQKRFFTALSRNVTELAQCMPAGQEERTENRYLWEELAEPLWLRYGLPVWMGILLSVRYVDLGVRTRTGKQLEQILAGRKERPEEKLWIPAEDVDLLVNMAMAGIEMLPQQERLSWQQIKEFYMKFSRSV